MHSYRYPQSSCVYYSCLNLSWCLSYICLILFFFSSISPYPSVYCHMLQASVNYYGNFSCEHYTCIVSYPVITFAHKRLLSLICFFMCNFTNTMPILFYSLVWGSLKLAQYSHISLCNQFSKIKSDTLVIELYT